jgi:hypothetical protein
MSRLRSLQRDFSRHVFGDKSADLITRIKSNGLNPVKRLAVYRNNTYVNFTNALRTTYPVVARLVGDGFFRYAVHEYIAQHPSSSGDLHQFGAAFANFLATFESAAGLPYLPDVARLEWAYEQAFYAVESAPFNSEALAKVPHESYEALKFVLNPAVRLITSKYPILRIWQVNQEGFEGDQGVDLTGGGVQLLVIRDSRLDVGMKILGEGEFVLLQALADGQVFAMACEQALNAQPDCDIPACLKQQIIDGVIIDFIV